LVRQRMKAITVPLFVQNHLEQLEPVFFNMLRIEDYREAIATGMAEAYYFHPEDVEKVIEKWLTYCEKNQDKISYNRHFSYRDKVVITIIMTLARIEYKQENGLNASAAYEIIGYWQFRLFR